ncbi:hypothetical protein MVLG_06233 [Microbotryum lychnidis-dioicae p1A1 Lamole]|uniref:UBA domain-containing protein n=1 Tax=Microbotryum lychnidis-dioicae (strain p1A1 Lamole / MvSl-1064) TaxID=683840 RepID=U5HGM8_USTV1|nr:hypothetical protein MVLG_06233 [Microbotryum lychnidis-dioicae p1A1 Lamole]|eukprot:KDE03276.1 hypothetical protein MVLG_06233 [Microbotryum lychnidis-dioicae p1A1 Lamole]
MTQLTLLEDKTVEQLKQMGFPAADAVRAVRRKGTNFDHALDALLSGENLGDDTDIIVDTSSSPAPAPSPAPAASAATTAKTTSDEHPYADADEDRLPPPYGPSSASFGPPQDYHEARPASTALVPFKSPRSKWSPDVDLTLDEETDPIKPYGGFDPHQLADALEQSTKAGRRFSLGPASSSTATLGPSSNDEESDYQRAIAMSMQEAEMASSNANMVTSTAMGTDTKMIGPDEQRKSGAESTQNRGLEAGDDDIEKAISLSLGDLRDQMGPGGAPIAAIKPEDRIRQPDQGPVIVRSTSALLGLLSSFIQCLYAVPTWRKAVLEFRPNQFDLGCSKSLQGIWDGTEPPALEGTARDEKDPVWALIAIQRLFALMQETKRSFLHITEATQVLDPNGLLLLPTRIDAVEDVSTMIEGLISTFRLYSTLDAKPLPLDERPLAVQKVVQRFSLSGKTFNNNPVSLAEPLDENMAYPIGDSIAILRLRVPTFFVGVSAPTLYQFIDANLNELPLPSTGKPASFSLITQFSQSLIVRLDRYEEGIISLDDFGSSSIHEALSKHGEANVSVGAPRKRSRRSVKFEETLWLDRYDASRRLEIAQKIALVCDLRRQVEDLERMRNRWSSTLEGKEALGLIRDTREYLNKDEGEEDADDVGKERRKRLKIVYEKIEQEVQKKIRGCDEVIEELRETIDATFDRDEWKRRGPYELKAVLMRNGLNGRGSSWAVVKEEGKWWRIKDLEKEEVSFEQVVSDPSGLMMSAGATLLFYDNPKFAHGNDGSGADTSITIPSVLRSLILQDNHNFASELPTEIVETWTPPLERLPPTPPMAEEEPWVDRLSGPATPQMELAPPSPPLCVRGPLTTAEDVIEILPPTETNLTPSSPVAVDLAIDDDSTVTADFKNIVDSPKAMVARETSMSAGASVVAVDEQADALRLRGGAADDVEMESGEEQEYSDDKDFDDDEEEVELGLLQPMSARDKEWNIDFAIGKVSGKPVWLDPRSPLEKSQVACPKCGKTMTMLLQVNSPDDTRPHAAARSLFVFACPRKECSSKDAGKAMKVWRVQMPSPNEFYPHTEETQKRRRELEAALDPTTALAGSVDAAPCMWPEWDVICESEPYEDSYLESDRQPTEGAAEDADLPDTQSGVDKAFLTFQERVERVPKQVLRFYRLPGEEEPQPLWANKKKVTSDQVQPCSLCGAKRQVEFQILSTLLSFLKDDHFSFDSLLVFTCVENCAIPDAGSNKSGWAEEVLISQDFDQHGVRFGRAAPEY